MKQLSFLLAFGTLSLAVGVHAGPAKSKLIANLDSKKPQTIVCYGTSLTANGAWTAPFEEALRKKYPGLVKLVNSGGSGQWSKWGLDNLKEKALDKKPDAVFIEFSMNDAVTRFNCSLETSRKNLEKMSGEILKANPNCEIIVMTMNPAISGSPRPKLDEYYEVYRSFAKEKGLLLVDNYAEWAKLLSSDKERFKKYVPDGVHPTAEGCKAVTLPKILESIGYAPPK